MKFIKIKKYTIHLNQILYYPPTHRNSGESFFIYFKFIKSDSLSITFKDETERNSYMKMLDELLVSYDLNDAYNKRNDIKITEL
jgi:hypothetical protein